MTETRIFLKKNQNCLNLKCKGTFGGQCSYQRIELAYKQVAYGILYSFMEHRRVGLT